MSSLLQRTTLPLWAWIVIIVVASLLVITTFASIFRCWIIRRRAAGFLETFGTDNFPERRVTVRRGRVVPSSNYLSLTGSKFGLNAFTAEELDEKSPARSKSLFEWWTTIKDRSHSRQSQVILDSASVSTAPPSPTMHKFYQRRDVQHSTSTLTSNLSDKQIDAMISEVNTPRTSIRRSHVNFSRSFSPQAPYLASLHHTSTLARIEESSPHHSLIDKPPLRKSASSFIKEVSVSRPREARTSSRGHLDPSLPGIRSPTPEPNPEPDRTSSTVSLSALPEIPAPTAHPTFLRSSLDATDFQAQHHRHKSDTNAQNRTSNTHRPHRRSQTTTNSISGSGYWSSRKDLEPIHRPSQKGNVLRKKSLHRTEIISLMNDS